MNQQLKESLGTALGLILSVCEQENQKYTCHISDIQRYKNVADVESDVCVALSIQAANIRALEMICMLLADVAGVPRYQPDPAPDPEIPDYAI
jgi:hypothetical protein